MGAIRYLGDMIAFIFLPSLPLLCHHHFLSAPIADVSKKLKFPYLVNRSSYEGGVPMVERYCVAVFEK